MLLAGNPSGNLKWKFNLVPHLQAASLAAMVERAEELFHLVDVDVRELQIIFCSEADSLGLVIEWALQAASLHQIGPGFEVAEFDGDLGVLG